MVIVRRVKGGESWTNTAVGTGTDRIAGNATGSIATVYLRWKDPETKEVIETKQPFGTQDLAATFTSSSPRLQWSTVVAEYAEVLRASPFAKGSTLAGVTRSARSRFTRPRRGPTMTACIA